MDFVGKALVSTYAYVVVVLLHLVTDRRYGVVTYSFFQGLGYLTERKLDLTSLTEFGIRKWNGRWPKAWVLVE